MYVVYPDRAPFIMHKFDAKEIYTIAYGPMIEFGFFAWFAQQMEMLIFGMVYIRGHSAFFFHNKEWNPTNTKNIRYQASH
jgi:hypothetical protein